MGSFYGGGGIVNGGSAIVDYSTLQNAPITVLTGRNQSNFINISGLDFGHYHLKGYYKKDSQSEIDYAEQTIDMVVCYDEITSKKIVRYFTIEQETMYLNLIVYEEDGTSKYTKKPLNGSSAQVDIPWEEM